MADTLYITTDVIKELTDTVNKALIACTDEEVVKFPGATLQEMTDNATITTTSVVAAVIATMVNNGLATVADPRRSGHTSTVDPRVAAEFADEAVSHLRPEGVNMRDELRNRAKAKATPTPGYPRPRELDH